MKNFTIRQVKPEDAKEYIKLNNLVWRDAYKHIFPEEVFLQRESQLETKVKTFSDFVYNDDSQMVYVAEDKGKIIGFISGKILSEYEHYEALGYADLMAIYIRPDYQGLGIGTKFKDLFIEFLKLRGKNKFVIGVLKENYNARKVYEAWGGKLDTYSAPFVRLGVEYPEVFYTFEIW